MNQRQAIPTAMLKRHATVPEELTLSQKTRVELESRTPLTTLYSSTVNNYMGSMSYLAGGMKVSSHCCLASNVRATFACMAEDKRRHVLNVPG